MAARADQRNKLERLCRTISRPALSQARLSLTPGGHVRYQLKTPYRDGTTYELFVREKLDALAGLRPRLAKDVRTLPGARLLDGRFTAVQQAVGTPRARVASAVFLAAFVEEAKASGLVARLIERHGVRGVNVAPAA